MHGNGGLNEVFKINKTIEIFSSHFRHFWYESSRQKSRIRSKNMSYFSFCGIRRNSVNVQTTGSVFWDLKEFQSISLFSLVLNLRVLGKLVFLNYPSFSKDSIDLQISYPLNSMACTSSSLDLSTEDHFSIYFAVLKDCKWVINNQESECEVEIVAEFINKDLRLCENINEKYFRNLGNSV